MQFTESRHNEISASDLLLFACKQKIRLRIFMRNRNISDISAKFRETPYIRDIVTERRSVKQIVKFCYCKKQTLQMDVSVAL